MSLLDSLRDLTPAQLDQALARMDDTLAHGVLVSLQEDLKLRCAQDGLYFLRFAKTRDEADPQCPVKPFPLGLEYVPLIWSALVSHNRTIIAKSRQMLASWILCAFCVWWARFRPNQAIFWQSQKDDDSNAMIALPGAAFGRCQFIEANLPPFLQQPIKTSEGKIIYPNGSFIQALAGGADQVRGRVFSILVEDEFAHQMEQGGVYTAVAPLIQKGAKVVFVSTPNGADNVYAQLWFGNELDRG